MYDYNFNVTIQIKTNTRNPADLERSVHKAILQFGRKSEVIEEIIDFKIEPTESDTPIPNF